MTLVSKKEQSILAAEPANPSEVRGRFAINLTTSREPNRIPANRRRDATTGAVDYEHLHFYQLADTDDGHRRYRLRLGPFETDLECDAVLSVVRNRYPDAFRVDTDELDREALKSILSRLKSVNHSVPGMLDSNYSIDSTGTTRRISGAELGDPQGSKCYSIQLFVSDHVVLPEEVPALDIFEFYCLYAVTSHQDECINHSVRLGFYSNAEAAETVANYLRKHFEAAEVMRVSLDEGERFRRSQLKAKKDVGGTGQHAYIEIKSARER